MIARAIGWSAHRQAVDLLRDSYDSISPGNTIRLAKKTSNLFRSRSAASYGLDVSGLGGVINVDPAQRIADVQGMCRYEDLVDATLPYGLIPLVVPQLRTITLGGAVTGLGIEATSFRNGLPHESVLELDILTGTGELVTARPDNEHAELFSAFPNSLGSLGYATRLRIELMPIASRVELTNVRFDDVDQVTAVIGEVMETGEYNGVTVDVMDGVMFHPAESYLVLGHFTDTPGRSSDYTGEGIYYQSLRAKRTDHLTAYDYLWRWDTDWFWCSAAFGAQIPSVRRLWPKRFRRSDVYHRIVRLEDRYGVVARIGRWRGHLDRERVIQDVELPLERTGDFLRWFAREVQMMPVWLCPLRLRQREWPLYPMHVGQAYVNVGFWGTVPIAAGAKDGDINRAIESKVLDLGGHKSLYSDAYYDRETFDRLYGGLAYRAAKDRYDPGRRLTDLYDKVVGRK